MQYSVVDRLVFEQDA